MAAIRFIYGSIYGRHGANYYESLYGGYIFHLILYETLVSKQLDLDLTIYNLRKK